MILTGDAGDARDMGLVKDVLETLEQHYPNYQWLCRIDGGLVMVSSTVINWILYHAGYKGAASFCMALKYSDVAHDANHRKKQVMRVGGQLLERAKKARKPREIGDFTPIKGFDQTLGGLTL